MFDNIENRKLSRAKNIFEISMIFFLAIIFFDMPTFFTKYALQGFDFDKQICFCFWILLALVAWLSIATIEGEIKIRRTPLDIPIGIFWFSYLLSTFFSVDRWHSFWGFFGDPTHGLVNITTGIIAYYIILSNFSMKRFRIFLGAIFVSGIVVLVWEVLIIRGVINLQDPNFLEAHNWVQYIPSSRIGSISGTSIFLSVLVILLIAAFLRVKMGDLAKFKKIILGGIFLIMIAASLYLLLAFNFFTPWLSFIFGVGFFLAYVLAGMAKVPKNSSWLPSIVFGYIILAILFGSIFLASVKIVKVTLPAEVNLQHNFSWQIAKNTLLKHNFFLGSGPATYGYDFSLYKTQDFNLNNLYNLRFYKSSGIFWELLSTVGIFGTLAFILLAFYFFSIGIYLLNRKKEINKIYSLGLMSSMIVIFISSIFVRMDGAMIILGMLLATLTVGVVLKENDIKEEYLKISLKALSGNTPISVFIFLIATVGVVFSVVFLTKVFAADIYAGMASKQKNITKENSIKMIEKAIILNSREGRYYTLAGQQYMELANSEFIKGEKADKNLFGKYLDSALIFTAKGKALMPKDVAAVETFAEALENKALYFPQFSEQAVAVYNDALALEPHNAIYFLKIGKIRTMQAAPEKDESARKNLIIEAKDWFQKSVDQKNNLAEAQFQLGSMQQLLGEKDDSILSLQKAIVLDNSNASYFLMLANVYQTRGSDGDYENAENIYKNVISVQDNDPSVHLSLGLLYEKKKYFRDASLQYKKVLDLLPQENKDAKTKIQKMIANVDQGIENTAENIKEPITENISQ